MSNYSLFSVIGIEIEYMLVDQDTLNIKPISDQILTQLAGKLVNEAKLDHIAISNELVLHVLEFKNARPEPLEAPLVAYFQQAIQTIAQLLQEQRLLLLPTGAHPWMDPHTETKRWPHDNQEIYRQYDRIFDCKGHGWSNLQSMHVNLPFANDEEFHKLHAAIRLLLPLLPALAASTPFLGGQLTGFLDTRLHYYGQNQQKIPSITGEVIPESVSSSKEYQETILSRMYRDIKSFDPENILQYEWLNSRGAIAKFDMGAIEIRLLDSQECVTADIAIARVIAAILKHWIKNHAFYLAHPCPTSDLKHLYHQTLTQGLKTPILNKTLFDQWQISPKQDNIKKVWEQLITQVSSELDFESQQVLETILSQGNLSERLIQALGGDYQKQNLVRLYRELNHCLYHNHLFQAS